MHLNEHFFGEGYKELDVIARIIKNDVSRPFEGEGFWA